MENSLNMAEYNSGLIGMLSLSVYDRVLQLFKISKGKNKKKN